MATGGAARPPTPAHQIFEHFTAKADARVFMTTPGEGRSRRCAGNSLMRLSSPRTTDARQRSIYSSPHLLKDFSPPPGGAPVPHHPKREALAVLSADIQASADVVAAAQARAQGYSPPRTAPAAPSDAPPSPCTPKMARMRDAHHWYRTASARQLAEAPVVRPSSARPLHPAEHSVSHQRALSAARSDIFGLSIADRGHWSIAPYKTTL